MQWFPINCHACGSKLQIPQDSKIFFCMYCGSKYLLDDGSKTVTYHSVDEARIHEADVHERLELRKLEQADEMRKIKLRITPVVAIVSLLMLLIGVLALSVTGDDNNPWGIFAALGFLGLIVTLAIWIPWNNEDDEKRIKAWDEKIKSFTSKFS